jgi:hypothetical protein
MIFPWLYKRKLTQTFGGYVPKHKIKEITGGFSEWESFKLLLPLPIYRLFFKPAMSETDALKAVQKMTLDVLRNAPNLAGDKRSAPSSPTKPN